jgi:hypothetical protein
MPDAVIVALVKRRADLAGELNDTQGRLNQLHADLAALDDVISAAGVHRRDGVDQSGRAGHATPCWRASERQGHRGSGDGRAGAERAGPGSGAFYDETGGHGAALPADEWDGGGERWGSRGDLGIILLVDIYGLAT